MRTIPLLLALSLAAPPPARPAEQEPPPAFVPAPAVTPATRPAQEQATILPVTAAEVGVDFVVRDKKGRIVRDLKPSDIEVYEDGVRQEIGLFRLVSTAPADAPPEGAPEGAPPVAGASAPAGAPPAPDVEREAVVALVFDRLSPAARVSAHDAALAWLKTPAVAGREVGVFRIDQGLEEVQGFTDDRGPVMDALEDVARAAPTSFQSREDRQKLRDAAGAARSARGPCPQPGRPAVGRRLRRRPRSPGGEAQPVVRAAGGRTAAVGDRGRDALGHGEPRARPAGPRHDQRAPRPRERPARAAGAQGRRLLLRGPAAPGPRDLDLPLRRLRSEPLRRELLRGRRRRAAGAQRSGRDEARARRVVRRHRQRDAGRQRDRLAELDDPADGAQPGRDALGPREPGWARSPATPADS